jgi:hypothetical protein
VPEGRLAFRNWTHAGDVQMKTVAREKAAPAPAVEISGSLNELFEKTLAENRAQAAKEK